MLIEVLNDVYFIRKRLKEIDVDYKIFFNTEKSKFEVHNIGQIGDSFCLTVPFQYLDERTVEYVRKTRVENRKKLLEELDRENEKLQLQKEKEILNEAKDKLFEEIKHSKF